MTVLETLMLNIRRWPIVYTLTILPFYFLRFIYCALRERSIGYLRYPPGHYASAIPSGIQIRADSARLFSRENQPIGGIDLNEATQLEVLRQISAHCHEFDAPASPAPGHRYYYDNLLFGYFDALVLHGLLRAFQPSQVIEIGSGFSSALMLDVAEKSLQGTHFRFIDPYSQNIVSLLDEPRATQHEVIRTRVQDIDPSVFASLGHNDVLFVDSSHVLKIGSDLSRIFFDVLPMLAPGVLVHFHDIYWPFEYPESLIGAGRIWNESYAVRSFLQYNYSFQIIFYSSFLEHSHRAALERDLPGFDKDIGKSLWLRKTG